MPAPKAGGLRRQPLSIQSVFVEADPSHVFRDGSGNYFSN